MKTNGKSCGHQLSTIDGQLPLLRSAGLIGRWRSWAVLQTLNAPGVPDGTPFGMDGFVCKSMSRAIKSANFLSLICDQETGKWTGAQPRHFAQYNEPYGANTVDQLSADEVVLHRLRHNAV